MAIIIGYSLEEEKDIGIPAYPPQPAQSPPNTIRDTSDKPVRQRAGLPQFDSTRRWRLRFYGTTSSRRERNTSIIAEDLSGKPAGLQGRPSAGRRETLTPLSSQLAWTRAWSTERTWRTARPEEYEMWIPVLPRAQ
jgi:hypothetical protein